MKRGAFAAWGRLLRDPDFRLLWISQSLSGLGSAVHQVAMVIYVYQITGSPLTVTVLLASAILPTMLLVSVVAVTIDRYPYRQTMIVTDLLRGIVVMAMAWSRSPAVLLLLTFAQASLGRFFTPAQLALLPRMLPKDDLQPANSLISATWRTLTLVGPALAAWIVVRWGAPGAFYFNGLSYVVSGLLLVGLRSGRQAASEARASSRRTFGQKWAEGFAHIRGDQVLWLLLIITVVLGLPTGVNNALLVVFIGDVLGLPLATLGYLSSALAVGFILGGIVAASLTGRLVHKLRVVVAALAILGLGFGAFGLCRSLVVALFLRAMIGLGFALYVILCTTLYQERLPPEVRGKALSLYSAVDDTANLVTLGLAGLVAEICPVQYLFVGAGLCLIVLAGYSALRWSVRRAGTWDG